MPADCQVNLLQELVDRGHTAFVEDLEKARAQLKFGIPPAMIDSESGNSFASARVDEQSWMDRTSLL